MAPKLEGGGYGLSGRATKKDLVCGLRDFNLPNYFPFANRSELPYINISTISGEITLEHIQKILLYTGKDEKRFLPER